MNETTMKLDKTALCRELWREKPDATAKEIAELFEARHGESCATITAQKAKPSAMKKGSNGKKDNGGELTASELRAVKEAGKKAGGLDKLLAMVGAVEEAAGQVGGIERLRAGISVLQELFGNVSGV